MKKEDIKLPNIEGLEKARQIITDLVKIEPSNEFFEKIEATDISVSNIEFAPQEGFTTAWGELPNYNDYNELMESELELDRIKTELNKLVDEMEYPSPEFEQTFKKRIKDILA
jgi:hypothetical protein